MHFAKKPRSSSESIQIVGFSVSDAATTTRSSTRLSWSERAVSLFRSIAAAASANGGKAGPRLPHSTLRALVSATLPDPLLVVSDLALPDARSVADAGRSLVFAESGGAGPDCVRAVDLAARRWVSRVLSPWAEVRGVPPELVQSLSDLAIAGELATAADEGSRPTATAAPQAFGDARDAIHAALVRGLSGTELFPGLGAARCLIRSSRRDNSVSFVTFPRVVGGDRRDAFSMRARFTVETLPGVARPFVRLDVSRLRWCPEVPTALMPRQRRLTATVFGSDERRAVAFEVPVEKGKVHEPEDPAYGVIALGGGIDIGRPFADHVAAGPVGDTFVGIAYAPAYEPAPAVATGVTELDILDCYDRVMTFMEGQVAPLEGEPVAAAARVSREKSDIPAVKAVSILEEIAQTLGHNDIGDDAIADAWGVLHGGELPGGIELGPKAADARRKFEGLQRGNSDRMRATFGDEVPPIVVLSASAAEGAAIVEIVRSLFSGRIRIENRLLPEGVHGPRKDLAEPQAPARKRYESRIEAWTPLATRLREDFGSSRVLVHARRFQDDVVNKIAGRVALARFGNCNVQYLDGRGYNANEWFFRIQAAVLDLMFGHSGLVSPVAEDVGQAFPDPATRPRSILGISVVSQNRTHARSASSFFLSVAIDVATGRTTATAACPKDGDLEFKGPSPFFDLLKEVAGWEGTSIGSSETAKTAFQEFVDQVVGEACERGERPLVMVDGAHARQLWTAVANAGWGTPAALAGRPFDAAADWPGARLVRIQDTGEPSVLTRKLQRLMPFDPETGETGELATVPAPTVTNPARLVRIKCPAPAYVSTGDLDGQQKIAKGLSVYRPLPYYKKTTDCPPPAGLDGWEVMKPSYRDLTNEPYKLPGVIGILVSHSLPGDDPDRIAALCHALRQGFGHTRSPTRLPAPLFHTRKVAEYIPAYVLDDEDIDEVAPEDGENASGEDDGAGPDESFRRTDDEVERPPVSGPATVRPGLSARPALSPDALPHPFSRPPNGALSPALPANPLTALVEAALSTRMSTLGAFPVAPDVFKRMASTPGASALPDEMRARAGGDAQLERLLERFWLGPLPRYMDEEWFSGLVANVSVKTRQQMKSTCEVSSYPPLRVIERPDFDTDSSFALFLRSVLSFGDGANFLRTAISRQFSKTRDRWIFAAVTDQVYKLARLTRGYEASGSTRDGILKGNLTIARQLHEAGHSSVLSQFIVTEPLLFGQYSARFSETATRLEADFGSDYAEAAAFCANLARYHRDHAEIRRDAIAWGSVHLGGRSPPRAGLADMDDAAEVAELAAIPDIPPPRVDALFLRDKISLSGAFRSHLHGQRALICSALGDDAAWPREKPSAEQIVEGIARLFSAPIPLLAAIATREKESLFKPFYRKIETAVKTIGEGHPHREGLTLSPGWTSGGLAPLVVGYLYERGYRSFASELALVRAVENPSLSLERAVAAFDEELGGIADFVRARRRATIWFLANDERAELELFATCLGAFEDGEIVMEKGGGMEPQEEARMEFDAAEHADTAPVTSAASGSDDGVPLETALALAVETARRGLEAFKLRDFPALEDAVAELEKLAASARSGMASIERTTTNAGLVARAAKVRDDLAALLALVGGDTPLTEVPDVGEIGLAEAERADGELVGVAEEVALLEEAVRSAQEMDERSRTLSMIEKMAVWDDVRKQWEDARERLADIVAGFNAALALLVPDSVPEKGTGDVPARREPDDPYAAHAAEPDTARDDAVTAPEETVLPELATADLPEGPSPGEDEPFDDDTDFDVSDLGDVLPADSRHLEPLAAPVEAEADPVEQPMAESELDPVEVEDAARIDATLQSLVAAGSFGLAYHLARASEAENPARVLPVTSIEARLAALAGNLNHTSLQSAHDTVSGWVQDAFKAADLIELDEDRERAAVRLMNLMPLMIELGIFFPSLGAGEFLRKFISLPGEIGSRAQRVFESVSRIQHTNVTFSRAMLANVANELDCSKALNDVRLNILKKMDSFSAANFDFQLAAKIRNELFKADNLVGSLRAQLSKAKDDGRTLDLIRDFVARLADRGRIVQIFDETELRINDRYQGLDGVARNRMIMFLEDLRDLANGYIELMAEVEEAKASERPKVREFAKQIAESVEDMTAGVDATSGDLGRISVAARHVSPRLRKVARILSGEAAMSVASSHDIHHACHAELALLPELEYGRSWLPSPYSPSQIVELLCAGPSPALPPGKTDREEAFETAVRARMDRSSYVGAKLLLDAAGFFGIDEALVATLSGDREAQVVTAKENLRSEFDALKRMVERVVRFGSLRQGHDAEEATGMLDRIDKLEAMKLPAVVEPGDRTETEMDGVYDVSVAIEEIENIKFEAQQLLDEPRNRLERRIDELGNSGTIDPRLVAQLRALCQNDDLLTAEEHIDEVVKTGTLSESRKGNDRIRTFMDKVLPALEHHRHEFSREAAAAIRDGMLYGGVSFEELSEARRVESAEVMETWRELYRRFHDRGFAAHLSDFLGKVGIKAEIENLPSSAKSQMKAFIGDFRATIPSDHESLLLPDFGSRTDGMYRMIVAQSMPTDAVISENCKVGKLGVVVLVNDIVTANQRKQFYLRNLAESRRVLLVDSASLLFTLGELSIRPLTLIELAQPYSYVSPYNDWGNDAVPPEMFAGREEDLAKITDPEGSNVVYGGRRMGKTAIFRHLVGVNHAPENGMLVAYVDAREIGRGNTATKVVWSLIAAQLREVFNGTVPPDPRKIRETIEKWLSADGRRRVLLLLDECDQFVVSDAANGYGEFLELQKLMTSTRRRFKVVLAGLSDVTRLVQTGNPPLKQIAANPRRIGSLTGAERADAEDLLLRPFAALGLEFERTDVWRILSHANYYPVLIQTYAQRILQAVVDRTKATQKPMRKVPTDLVAGVLDDVTTRSEIKRIFEFTLGIDPRYRLIAFVVANLVFQAEAEGRIDDGFALHQIRENAVNFWEAGFQDKNRFSLFDDLLDEMEGLGIVRRVNGDRWTLRSSAVVRLLGTRDEIESAILHFGDQESPLGFDPKSQRRELAPTRNVLMEPRSSPLTLGQERELLLTKARATVIVGNRLSDYPLATHAIRSVPESFSDGEIFETRIVSAASPAELEAALREIKTPTGKKAIVVVPAAISWTSHWVRTATLSKPVARGDVKLVFVGGPEHAASVFEDKELATLTSHVDVVPLEPWSTAYFNDVVNKLNVVTVQKFETCVNAYGGWNMPMWQLVHGGPKRQPELPDADALGLTGRYGRAIAMVAGLHGLSPVSQSDIHDYILLDEELASLDVSAKVVVDYGLALGLLLTASGKTGPDRGQARYLLSPVAARALGAERKAAAE